MNNTIHLIGINHRTAAVDVREKFPLTNFCSPETWAILTLDGISESLILSPCNRVEVLVGGEGDIPRQRALEYWAKARGRTVEELEPYLYQYKNDEAIRHLFNIASSLDSLVLGEPQILGRLKSTYRKATQNHSEGTIINRLLQKTFSVAKRVRSETSVASSAVSISYAAMELAKQIFDDMSQHNTLIIGEGEMAELTALHLKQAGVKRIRVSNRTYARAEELTHKLGGEAVPFDKLFSHLVDTDIVISSTGAPDAIIHEQDMRDELKKPPHVSHQHRHARDIEPSVNTLDNIYLYDIDDLKEVVEEHIAEWRKEAVRTRAIVDEETADFHQWLDSLTLQSTIMALVERGQRIMDEELAKTLLSAP